MGGDEIMVEDVQEGLECGMDVEGGDCIGKGRIVGLAWWEQWRGKCFEMLV